MCKMLNSFKAQLKAKNNLFANKEVRLFSCVRHLGTLTKCLGVIYIVLDQQDS